MYKVIHTFMKYRKRIGITALTVGVASTLGLGVDSAFAVHESDIPKRAENTMEDGQKVRLTDGSLVASEESGVHLLRDGKKWPIASPQVFKSYGYSFDHVTMIPQETLDSIPNGAALPAQSGTLISAAGDPKVYVVENGMKRHIPSPEILENAGYSFDHVNEVSQASVDRHPTGDDYTDANYIPNGSTVYAEGTGAFKIEDDMRRPIPDPETFRSNFGDFGQLRKVSEDSLNSIPEGRSVGPADRTLVADDSTVYVVEDGMKRPFSSPQELREAGFSFDDIRNIPQEVVNDVPMGPSLDMSKVNKTQTLAKNIMGADGLSMVLKAVRKAGLTKQLQGDTEYTVFAPTNDAFEKLDESTRNDLMTGDSSELTTLLKDHLVEGNVTASELSEMDEVTTLNGNTLNVNVMDDGSVEVGGVKVDETDIEASNGVLHTVESVIQT